MPKQVLTKDQMLKIQLAVEDVEYPGIGSFRIRELTGAERDRLEEDTLRRAAKDGKVEVKGFRAMLVAMTLVDAGGERMFADNEIDKVNSLPAKLVAFLFQRSQEMNGVSVKGETKLGKD